MDAVEQAGWPTLQVFPLKPDEKLNIITGYMSLYAKTLNEEQTSLIIQAEQCNNPLYLKALLDEVRIKRVLSMDNVMSIPKILFFNIICNCFLNFGHTKSPLQ